MADEVKADEVKAEEVKAEEVKADEAAKAGDEAAEAVADEAKEAEEKEEEKEEEPKAPTELETDAVGEPASALKAGTAKMSASDATLNVMPVADGALLTALGEGGMAHLVAAARANVGVKSGRYMFEARVVENLSVLDQGAKQWGQVRLGFSTSGSSLFLSDSDEYVCFDSEGFFHVGKKKTKAGRNFGKDVMTVVLNLDEASPNAYTVSLFKKGARICKPQALPESLKGKALFPTVNYKNVTLEMNLGPTPLSPLPFKCHMVGGAGKADVEVVADSKPADGKYEVVFPVGLPDQGVLDWVDEFLENNRGYTELSDRMIIDWAVKSGMWRPKNNQGCNDKPNMTFGVPAMDDGSVRRMISSWAPTLRRNLVVAEIKANLVPADRERIMKPFKRRHFKMVAKVIMGEPTLGYKDKVQKVMLKKKTQKAENERRRKFEEALKKKKIDDRKKKQEEAKEKRKNAKKGEEAAEDEDKDDEAKEEEDEPAMEDLPAVELTEEEKGLWYRKLPFKDLSEKEFSKSFTKFSIPDKEEGFDEITFDWSGPMKSAEVLKQYVLEHKLTQKCDDLKPSAWFKEQSDAFKKTVQEWKKKANDWKDTKKREKIVQAKKDALKKPKEEGEEGDDKDKEEEIEIPEINLDDLDPFAVEDVADVGSGEPLFSGFTFEDWALMTIMFELHLLVNAFKKDLNDAERPSFPADHLSFYYNKYYSKRFELSSYGFKEMEEFVDILKGVVSLEGANKLFKAELGEDTPISNFVKLAEAHRRDRTRRIDAGDESATLSFNKRDLQAGKGGGDGKGEGKKSGGDDRGKKGGGKGDKGGRSKGEGKGEGRWERRESAPASHKGSGPRVGDSGGSKRPWAERGQERAPWGGRSEASSAGGGKRWGGPISPQEEPAWKRQRPEPSFRGGGGGGGGGGSYRGGPVGGAGGGYYRR